MTTSYDTWLETPYQEKEKRKEQMENAREFIRHKRLHSDPNALTYAQIEDIMKQYEANQKYNR